MSSVDALLEICSRLDHLEHAGEWVAKEAVHMDSTISQTGTLISVIADDLRDKICKLVQDFEKLAEMDKFH